MHQKRKTRFLDLWNELPSWDPVTDPTAKQYIQGLVDSVGGSYYWEFGCQRYFGSAVFETSRMVTRLILWL